ncbi:hypothetical protein TNCT_86601 [Trichonephila clavata]|uniref:Uncharacterized protein n=1 Tax=Trichonephila clavata TaxID=2740835 RepID=A0A8X6LXV1_TRICU|nr:hypothetical protein TNCT_86601 [Trichonephila clavata]
MFNNVPFPRAEIGHIRLLLNFTYPFKPYYSPEKLYLDNQLDTIIILVPPDWIPSSFLSLQIGYYHHSCPFRLDTIIIIVPPDWIPSLFLSLQIGYHHHFCPSRLDTITYPVLSTHSQAYSE